MVVFSFEKITEQEHEYPHYKNIDGYVHWLPKGWPLFCPAENAFY